jgi:undecaprenyl diphosphate synthase
MVRQLRIPKHIGVIPDGNRRWALGNGLEKQDGYDAGLAPGLTLFKLCREIGVEELTYYGFTQDNTKRPSIQRKAFQKACVDAVELIEKENANLLVIGNELSPMFPKKLLKYRQRTKLGDGQMKVNFLVNYGWQWDLSRGIDNLHSADISRVDLVIRWGGRRRLSGFLPIQAVYADFYVEDTYWPDFKPEHFYRAIEWYQTQDVTLGG